MGRASSLQEVERVESEYVGAKFSAVQDRRRGRIQAIVVDVSGATAAYPMLYNQTSCRFYA